MKTRLKRLLVFAIPIVLAIALIPGLVEGVEDNEEIEDNNEDIDGGYYDDFIGIDGGYYDDFIGIDGN